jgi:hypothetical protein
MEGAMNPVHKSEFSSYTPDELRELYKKDPKHFEELAEDAIDQACTGRNPEQSIKRRQMQWVISARLRKASTPLGRLQIMENIFYGAVFGAEGELAQLMNRCTELVYLATGTVAATSKSPSEKPALHLVKKLANENT